MSSFHQLPLEIKWQILDQCNAKTLCNLLSVSRKVNVLAKSVMEARLRRLMLFTSTGNNQYGQHRYLAMCSQSPDKQSPSVNLFDYCFEKSNKFEKPEYGVPPIDRYKDDQSSMSSEGASEASSSLTRVSSQGSTITSIDMDECLDNNIQHIRKLHKLKEEEFVGLNSFTPKSKFVQVSPDAQHRFWSTCPIPNDHNCASVDIKQTDYYGLIHLVMFLWPTDCKSAPLFTVDQRIDSDWWMEDEYLVHNRQISYRLQVERITREPFGQPFSDLVHRYYVDISEIFVNTGYLLDRIEATGNA